MLVFLILIWLTLVLIYYRLHTLLIAIDPVQKFKTPTEIIRQAITPTASIIFPKTREEKAIEKITQENEAKGQDTYFDDVYG